MRILPIVLGAMTLIAANANACACDLPEIGVGRVMAIVDGRTLRLDDQREIRLAGIELPSTAPERQRAADSLAGLALNKTITLRAETDAPDRYGRQHAIAMLDDTDSLQAKLLTLGVALASPLAPSACISVLRTAEAAGRSSRNGIWTYGTAIKNAERPGDILAAIGQFGIVDGTVRTVREAGSVTYVNFGRRWTEDFALTLPRNAKTAFENDSIVLKSFENRRVRVRGWIARQNGPRMAVFRVEQIELLGDNESRSGTRQGFGR